MAKRIGIYDRWLHVLGGGERYVGGLAEALGRTHDVTLLTHRPVDRRTLERSLQLDLARVRLATVPYDPDYRAVADASDWCDFRVASGESCASARAACCRPSASPIVGALRHSGG